MPILVAKEGIGSLAGRIVALPESNIVSRYCGTMILVTSTDSYISDHPQVEMFQMPVPADGATSSYILAQTLKAAKAEMKHECKDLEENKLDHHVVYTLSNQAANVIFTPSHNAPRPQKTRSFPRSGGFVLYLANTLG